LSTYTIGYARTRGRLSEDLLRIGAESPISTEPSGVADPGVFLTGNPGTADAMACPAGLTSACVGTAAIVNAYEKAGTTADRREF